MSDVDPRIVRARIRIIQRAPFFGYLVMHLTPKEVPDDTPMGGPAAVDIKGNLYYKPKLLDELSESELQGVICHEIMHCALQHLTRRGKRDPDLFNVAGDLVINDILEQEEFRLPEWVLRMTGEYAKYKGMFTEEIYEDLRNNAEEIQGCSMIIYADGDGESDGDGKDNDTGDGSGKGTAGKLGLPKELQDGGVGPDGKPINWKRVLVEAATHAKMMGKLPGGIEGLVDAELEPPKFRWRELLWKYIDRLMPQNFTWSRPSKKSRAMGYYIPDMTRESIDITVWLDTSGSIGDEEYIMFISELYAIARSFESLTLTIGLCDASVNATLNGQGPDEAIEMARNRKGYGGTDFRPGIEWTEENKPDTKLIVYFTDGWGSFPDYPPQMPVLWVYTEESADPDDVPFGQVIKIEE